MANNSFYGQTLATDDGEYGIFIKIKLEKGFDI